jgi:hypothetical protein
MILSLRQRCVALVLSIAASGAVTGCFHTLRAAQSLRVVRTGKTPADASVTIDEQYIGPLAFVAARGVRLPLGEHRITVERDGYFPFDARFVAGRDPIRIQVALVPVPD